MKSDDSANADLPIAYGQMFEDTFLFRIFGEQKQGFYLDIGGWHPVKYSVSYPFYLRGWRGVIVEPIRDYADLTRCLRPGDVTIETLVGEQAGETVLYRAAGLDGLSTTMDQYAQTAADFGAEIVVQRHPVTTASDILREHAPPVIDFLKVDVEGAEASVLAGLDFSIWRPRVLVIEATVPGTDIPAWDEWEPALLQAGYVFGLFDGLNRYYIDQAEVVLLERLRPEEKPWGEAAYLEEYGPAVLDRKHPDHAQAGGLQGALLGNMARLPGTAAALIAADLVSEPRSVAASLLGARFPVFGGDLPVWLEDEAVTDYVGRLLLHPSVLPVLGRLSAQLAR